MAAFAFPAMILYLIAVTQNNNLVIFMLSFAFQFKMQHFTLKMHHIASRVVEEPPMTIRDGGIFQDGVNEQLDDLRQKAGEGTDWLKRFESRERERLDIPSLKVKQNRQFGFFIEVTKSHLDKIPEEYRRRQTMTNAERFTTE